MKEETFHGKIVGVRISHPSDLCLEMLPKEMERLLECPGLGGVVSGDQSLLNR